MSADTCTEVTAAGMAAREGFACQEPPSGSQRRVAMPIGTSFSRALTIWKKADGGHGQSIRMLQITGKNEEVRMERTNLNQGFKEQTRWEANHRSCRSSLSYDLLMNDGAAGETPVPPPAQVSGLRSPVRCHCQQRPRAKRGQAGVDGSGAAGGESGLGIGRHHKNRRVLLRCLDLERPHRAECRTNNKRS